TVGQGRRLSLKNPLSLEQAVRRVKKGLGLSRLRLAAAERHRAGEPIRRVALCACAGGGVLDGQAADLWLTGEMRHHDVLAAREAGISVLLAEHTNTERGYLPVLRDRLLVALDHKVEVVVSERDADPLTVV
ncbi:MAG: Nif3-like dinuclear metal center hexameric protein, partial [Salinibacterium sp.]|nr:Nif3-like dinuclear metal center hexameric protein [Salinibacterium sp.]